MKTLRHLHPSQDPTNTRCKILVGWNFPSFFFVQSLNQTLPAQVASNKIDFFAVYFRIDAISLVVSSLRFLFVMILWTFGAVIGYLTWGGLPCHTPHSSYRSHWSTLDVLILYIDFWPSRSGKWDLIRRAECLAPDSTTGEVLSIYSLSSTILRKFRLTCDYLFVGQ